MPEIPQDVIEKIKQRDLQNIAKQAAEGKALSTAQMNRLDAAAVSSGTDDEPLRMMTVEPCHVGQDTLSQLIGITDRRIRQLAAQGVLTKVARGHYPFPGVVQQYCEYLRTGGAVEGGRLKERELELKCKRLEQTINEYDTARRDDIESECWQDMQDFLAEYASELRRCQLDDDQRTALNNALERAVERVKTARMGETIPCAESEE